MRYSKQPVTQQCLEDLINLDEQNPCTSGMKILRKKEENALNWRENGRDIEERKTTGKIEGKRKKKPLR